LNRAQGGDSSERSASWRPWTERSEGSGWSHAYGKHPSGAEINGISAFLFLEDWAFFARFFICGYLAWLSYECKALSDSQVIALVWMRSAIGQQLNTLVYAKLYGLNYIYYIYFQEDW